MAHLDTVEGEGIKEAAAVVPGLSREHLGSCSTGAGLVLGLLQIFTECFSRNSGDGKLFEIEL
jgi:hypothetical protein